MAVELFEHNEQTYQNMVSMFETQNRVGVVQPTGTGKSFLYLKWIEDHPQDSFTILSPSTEIFTQLQEYAEASGSPDLLKSVQMISYQALLKMTDEDARSIHPNKMILDEFHRTGAEQWGPSLQRLLDANPQAKVLGASATPVRYLDNSKDMAAALFDRNLAVEMTLGEAVERNILPTPVYVPVWYDIDGKMSRYEQDVAQLDDSQKRREMQGKLEQLKRRLENAYGAEKIFKKHMPHDHGKYIVFCRDREHLEEMKQTVPAWLADVNGSVRSYVSLSAESDRDLQLQAFKDDKSEDAIKLLFTIDRLNEGLHVKGIDGVIMLRPTTSPIIYLQQMGRALSVGSKTPVIFDMVNNYQSVQIPLKVGKSVNVFEKEFSDAMESDRNSVSFRMFEDMKEFTSLFQQLESRLYPSRDEQWDMGFALVKEFVEVHNRLPYQKDSFKGVNIGMWCHDQKALAGSPNYPEARYIRLKELGLFDVSYDTKWENAFSLLKKFVATYNRYPKQREEYEGFKLGSWVNDQKKKAKLPTYPSDRREKLNAFGFFNQSSIKDVFDREWHKNFAVLESFVSAYQRLPQTDEVYQGVKVGAWCRRQKQQAYKGKLAPDKYALLEQKGFLKKSLNDVWKDNFSLLKKFVEEKKRFPKKLEIYEGFNIGSWVVFQRTAAQNDNYPADRKEMLQSIGLLDEISREEKFANQWDENYSLLLQFVSEHDRLPKVGEVYMDVNIGLWLANQKANAKSTNYPTERLDKLQKIGVFSATREANWEQKCSLVEQFVAEYHRLPKQKEEYHGVNIGTWLSANIRPEKLETMSEEKRRRLEAIGALNRRQPSLADQLADASSRVRKPSGRGGKTGPDGPGGR